MLKVEVYIPSEFEETLIDSISDKGYLNDDLYCRVYASYDVEDHWKSKEGASPKIGNIGEKSFSIQKKLEFRIKKEDMYEVDEIIRRIHPYERPIINYIPIISADKM